MKAHRTISMAKEVVVLQLERKTTQVIADFWFKNEGSATSVRMGFPDDDDGHRDGRQVLRPFRSRVEGRLVPTRFEVGSGRGWHIKTVAFPAHRTLHVRVAYTVKTGIGVLDDSDACVSFASYILSTGASWKGPIGDVWLTIRFGESLPRPTRVQLNNWVYQLDSTSNYRSRLNHAIRLNRSVVGWTGPAKPHLSGRSLSLHASNIEPIESDDITVQFFPRRDQRSIDLFSH